MAEPLPRGVIVAACTPIGADGRPDLAKLGKHLDRLRAERCVGVLLAGTTGEGSGLSLDDRRAIVEAAAGDADTSWWRFASTGTPSIEDTIGLTRHAIQHLAMPVILPPRAEGADERGVVAWYRRVIDEGVPDGKRVMLYNLPSLTGVRLTPSLVGSLLDSVGEKVGGLKDSSGDRASLHELRTRFPALPLYVGHEPLLVDAIAIGAHGALSGMANVAAPQLVAAAASAAAGDRAAAATTHDQIAATWAIFSAFQPYRLRSRQSWRAAMATSAGRAVGHRSPRLTDKRPIHSLEGSPKSGSHPTDGAGG